MKEVREDTWDKRRPIGRSTLKTLQYTCKHMICTHKYTNNYQEDAELSLIRVGVDWQDIVSSASTDY